MLCSPDRVRGAAARKKAPNNADKRRKKANDNHDCDEWSVGVDIRSESISRYTSYDDDDRSESLIKSEVGGKHRGQYRYDDCDRSESCIKSEIGSRVSMDIKRYPYHNNRHTMIRNENDNDIRGGGNTLQQRQEQYDKTLSYRQYHREDLSFYGTEAGGTTYYEASHYEASHYSFEDDAYDGGDSVSRLSEPFQHRRQRYRDSPFVRRR